MNRRAIIYVRQSIYREESESLETQEAINREYCRRHGYQVVAVESDPGISGTSVNRPGFRRVTEHLDAGRGDVVVAWKWSRYFRHRLHWNVAVDAIESRGGALESATEPVDVTTAAGRLQRGMLAEFAAFESERTGEVWKETHARRRADGLPAQGGERYGYIRRGDSYVPDPDQAAIVAWCYQSYLSGAGFAGIAADLNTRGHRNRLGREWSRTTVRQMLDAGFAAGLIIHGRNSAAVHHPGQHEAIISSQVWDAYVAARKVRRGKPSRIVEARYPLSGLLRCGDCGGAMHASNGGTRTAGHAFVCTRWRASRQGRCVTIVRHRAEAAVLGWLAELADDVGKAAAADEQTTRHRQSARRSAGQAARRVADLDAKLAELIRRNLDGTYPDEPFQIARDQIAAERTQAAAEREEAEARTAQARPQQMGAAAQRLIADWDVLAVKTRRDLLATMIRRVEVHPAAKRYGRAHVEIVPVWSTIS